LAVFLVGLVLVSFIGEGGFNPLKLTPVNGTQMVFLFTACIGMMMAWCWELVPMKGDQRATNGSRLV
jgi:hypothetical protein